MFYLHVVHEAAPYARRCDLGRVHLVSSIIAPFFNPNFAPFPSSPRAAHRPRNYYSIDAPRFAHCLRTSDAVGIIHSRPFCLAEPTSLLPEPL
jgi:hypothetical protein